jgi:hypothetical protein
MAGRIQIATRGKLDVFITNNPEYSYFTSLTKKMVNFSKQNIILEPNSPINFGEISKFVVKQNVGDLLSRIALKFTLPRFPDIPGGYDSDGVYNSSYTSSIIGFQPVIIYYTESIGHAVIEYVDLKIGDETIERLTGETLQLYTDISVPNSKKEMLFRTIYKYRDPFRRDAVSNLFNSTIKMGGSLQLGKYSDEDVIVDLPFYFSHRPDLNIPLCSIYNQEVSFEVKFKKIEDVIIQYIPLNYTDYTTNTRWGVTKPENFVYSYVKDLKIKSGTMSADIIFLDTVERMRLKYACRDYLMTETQLNSFKMKEELGKIPEDTFNLSFKNPVKELLFVIQRENVNVGDNNIVHNSTLVNKHLTGTMFVTPFDYDNSSLIRVKNAEPGTYTNIPIDSDKNAYPDYVWSRRRILEKGGFWDNLEHLSLELDGQEIISKDVGDYLFLGIANFTNHHVRTPISRKIYGYSFALKPDEPQPSGHINFSLFKNQNLYMKLFSSEALVGKIKVPGVPNTATATPVWDKWYVFPRNIRVYAKSYNILRVKDGFATKLF